MRKYQWRNADLQKKSQMYDWLMILCAVFTLALYWVGVPSLLLLVPFGGAVVFYMMSWRSKRQDSKWNASNKRR